MHKKDRDITNHTPQIRIIAPADSYKPGKVANYQMAQARLEAAGFEVSFGKHIQEVLHQGTAPAELRAADLMDAYADQDVAAIQAMHGGFASNEVLPLLDWDVIRANPKPLIGYSDITVLLNAVHARTGAVNYLGPNFGTIGYDDDTWQFSLDNLVRALKNDFSQPLPHNASWQDGRGKHTSKPWRVIQPGSAEGVLLGGNASTLYLIQGTDYQPAFDRPFILAFQADGQAAARLSVTKSE